ncbi:MAG: hypothetical protein LBR06_10745 [Bacteroidales bacterium]|jgi:hypothetical protein|nr:hypothetical protein [Bacteroidales bacterium]
MKKIILYIVFYILSINCAPQRIVFNLQQIEFKEKMLTKTLFDLTESEPGCLKKNGYYILDFFQSSLSNSDYYLSISKFITEYPPPKAIAYYVVINNVVFFISSKVSADIINVLPSKKEFVF